MRKSTLLLASLSILLSTCMNLSAQTAKTNTLQHPKDQIALQLGAIQMGYKVPFTLTGNISAQKMQQAVNALVMGRNALDATVAKPAVKVQGAVSSPNVDTVEYRDQLYSAVEYVATSPVVATIKGNATLTINKNVNVESTALTVPANAWTIPVPYALESRSSADTSELISRIETLEAYAQTLKDDAAKAKADAEARAKAIADQAKADAEARAKAIADQAENEARMKDLLAQSTQPLSPLSPLSPGSPPLTPLPTSTSTPTPKLSFQKNANGDWNIVIPSWTAINDNNLNWFLNTGWLYSPTISNPAPLPDLALMRIAIARVIYTPDFISGKKDSNGDWNYEIPARLIPSQLSANFPDAILWLISTGYRYIGYSLEHDIYVEYQPMPTQLFNTPLQQQAPLPTSSSSQ